MSIPENFAAYTGQPIEPMVYVLSKEGKMLTKDAHYSLEFDDNVNCGLVTVRAIGKNSDPQEQDAEVPEAYFVILPPAAEIESASAEDGSLRVQVKDLYSIGISGYQLEYRETGTEEWMSSEITDGSTEFMIEDLASGDYEVRVRAFVNVPTITTPLQQFDGSYYGEYSTVESVTK